MFKLEVQIVSNEVTIDRKFFSHIYYTLVVPTGDYTYILWLWQGCELW